MKLKNFVLLILMISLNAYAENSAPLSGAKPNLHIGEVAPTKFGGEPEVIRYTTPEEDKLFNENKPNSQLGADRANEMFESAQQYQVDSGNSVPKEDNILYQKSNEELSFARAKEMFGIEKNFQDPHSNIPMAKPSNSPSSPLDFDGLPGQNENIAHNQNESVADISHEIPSENREPASDSAPTPETPNDNTPKLSPEEQKMKNASVCEYVKGKIEEDFESSNLVDEKNLRYDGGSTNGLNECVILSKGNFRHLYSKNGQKGSKSDSWPSYLKSSSTCMKAALNDCKKLTTPINSSSGEEAYQKSLEECAQKPASIAQASECDGAAYIISKFDRDWNNSEHFARESVKGGNPSITCSSAGISTVDFEGCKKFVNNGAIMDAAQGALYQGQELFYQDKAMTAQMKASTSPDSATAGLQALHEGVKGQQDLMTQRAAVDTGKFAALATYYSEIPSYDDLIKSCNGYNPASGLSKDGCKTAVTRQQNYAFLMNQQAKEKMKGKLAQVGINVLSEGVMAALMAKRAKEINKAIAKVEAFKPIDPLAPAADNLQTTFCQSNPGDPKCLTGGLDRSFDSIGDNVITFGDGGTGTSYQNNNPFLDKAAENSNAIAGDASKDLTGVGSVINSSDEKGGLSESAGAASISKGSAPSSGGGGGGVGGSVGGAAVGSAGPQSGGASSAIAGKAPSYSGGGGSLSMMGGYGIKGKSGTKADDNPFGKLFNKDASKNGALEFGRAPASQKVGNKGDNLFEIISTGYIKANNAKRLIEYEIAK